jgi:hypothetical protein
MALQVRHFLLLLHSSKTLVSAKKNELVAYQMRIMHTLLVGVDLAFYSAALPHPKPSIMRKTLPIAQI